MTTAAAPAKALTFTRKIQASVELVYTYLTNRDDLCDWFCYDAQLRAEVGGHIFARWYEGNRFGLGHFTEIVENEVLSFTWDDGTSDSIITLELSQDGDFTTVSVAHDGLDAAEHIEFYNDFWEARLNRLKAVIETGENLDITERVIMGIFPASFDEEVAKNLGVPVSEGARVGGVVPGYSAEAAGIQTDDVVVQVEDQAIGGENGTIYNATQNKIPGDTVSVKFYRGADLHEVEVTLKGYPVPDIPENFKELAQRYAGWYADYEAKLVEVLKLGDEKAADFKPNDATWSARETLAAMVNIQRHQLQWLLNYFQGPRLINPFYEVQGRIDAIATTFPTMPELLDELRRTWAETVNVLKLLPDELAERKGYVWWITFESEGAGYAPQFVEQNIEQIRERLTAGSQA